MDAVLRSIAIYIVLMIVLRFSGRRTLSEMTTFDFVLLLVIGEATQQALLGEDFSMINAIVVILTLVGMDIGLSLLKQRSKVIQKMVEGVPMVIVEDGRPLRDRMEKARISDDEVLSSARRLLGIARMDQIKYAILEASGEVTIIPRDVRSPGSSDGTVRPENA